MADYNAPVSYSPATGPDNFANPGAAKADFDPTDITTDAEKWYEPELQSDRHTRGMAPDDGLPGPDWVESSLQSANIADSYHDTGYGPTETCVGPWGAGGEVLDPKLSTSEDVNPELARPTGVSGT